MSTIKYTLTNSIAVLGVYCNLCNECCSFLFRPPHTNIAFWTKNKDKILCPNCAEDNPDIIYRKVLYRKDIPINRSTFRAESKSDKRMYSDDLKNKEFYACSFFCSKEEEIEELTSGIPRTVKCDCGKLDCPEKINPEIQLLAKQFADKDFKITCKDPEIISNDCHSLVRNLFTYNYLSEFNDDMINFSHTLSGDEVNHYCGSISNVQIIVGLKSSPWIDGNLKDLKQRLVNIIDRLEFTVSFRYANKKKSNFWVYLTPIPFEPHAEKETDLSIFFETKNFLSSDAKKKINSDSYRPVIDGKIKNKEVAKIQAFVCPCRFDEPDRIKKSNCLHNVYIYFKDGSIKKYSDKRKITVDELQEKGYIPYITQNRPVSEVGYKKQLECCHLSKLIGQDKIKKFIVW